MIVATVGVGAAGLAPIGTTLGSQFRDQYSLAHERSMQAAERVSVLRAKVVEEIHNLIDVNSNGLQMSTMMTLALQNDELKTAEDVENLKELFGERVGEMPPLAVSLINRISDDPSAGSCTALPEFSDPSWGSSRWTCWRCFLMTLGCRAVQMISHPRR